MNQNLLSITTHFFAQCVFMNKIHYKAYYRYQKRQEFYRTITMCISGSTLGIIILQTIVMQVYNQMEITKVILSILSYVGLIFTAISLLFTMFQKEDISEIKLNHRHAAETYKVLRDEYLLFLEEIYSNDIDLSKMRVKSKNLQNQYSNIGKYSPTTTYDDYIEAQNSLGLGSNSDEEYTWSEEQINRFLPEKLRIS